MRNNAIVKATNFAYSLTDPNWDILYAIPPVASTAGEGGKPPGGDHLRMVLFAFNSVYSWR
jgi:hypothetical protein